MIAMGTERMKQILRLEEIPSEVTELVRIIWHGSWIVVEQLNSERMKEMRMGQMKKRMKALTDLLTKMMRWVC